MNQSLSGVKNVHTVRKSIFSNKYLHHTCICITQTSIHCCIHVHFVDKFIQNMLKRIASLSENMYVAVSSLLTKMFDMFSEKFTGVTMEIFPK